MQTNIQTSEKSPSPVYLVGAGPGDPDLLTRRAEKLIRECDALVFDYLVDPELLEWTKEDCEKICVGKRAGFHSRPQNEIEDVLVKLSLEGKVTVRLKGGDPLVFGRGGEEAKRLRDAGIPFTVVPAVTAAIAAAAVANIPLTHRSYNSSVVFITGHEDPEKQRVGVDWAAYAKLDTTLCLYMSMKHLDSITKELMQAGLDPQTPAAVVQWATTKNEKKCFSTLGKVAQDANEKGLTSPAIVIIGRTAGLGA